MAPKNIRRLAQKSDLQKRKQKSREREKDKKKERVRLRLEVFWAIKQQALNFVASTQKVF